MGRVSEGLLDQAGTLRFLATVKVDGTRIAARPAGMRLADTEATGPLPLEFVPERAPGVAAAPKNDVQWVDTPAALRAVSDELRAADHVSLHVETALDHVPERDGAGKGTSGRFMGLQSDAEESRQERSLSPIQPSLPTRI